MVAAILFSGHPYIGRHYCLPNIIVLYVPLFYSIVEKMQKLLYCVFTQKGYASESFRIFYY